MMLMLIMGYIKNATWLLSLAADPPLLSSNWDIGVDCWFVQQGVLTLKLGAKGTFVVNKQAPNRQIWLSSPVR